MFGVYPAMRASSLDRVCALHYEAVCALHYD